MKSAPSLIICMGISGCGKSSVARLLAHKLNYTFLEADDFHSTENKQIIAAGIGLTDAMREPWMNSICEALEDQRLHQRSCVIAHSALRSQHRERFRSLGFNTRFLFLDGSRGLIEKRMQARSEHFADHTILDSQLADLENPLSEADVIRLDIAPSLNEVVETAIRELHNAKPHHPG